LLGARPNQVRQRIISFSIFRLWFGTLLHRGVSPFVVEGGCFVAPISTRDAASFQLTPCTTFEYNSRAVAIGRRPPSTAVYPTPLFLYSAHFSVFNSSSFQYFVP
jgi:hypothetical protein